MVMAAAAAALWALPAVAHAEGPNAILKPAGYNANTIARGDDTSNLVVNLPFTMNWNGATYTQIYINMNGNCTFGSAFNGYNPTSTLAGTNRDMMAPFWADVDTRNVASGQVTYSSTTAGSVPNVNGRPAFLVNWIDVASYNSQASPLNSFQLVIVDRSDTGAGNFDFMFNYDRVTWDLATTASTVRARAGWGRAGTGFELPGSGTPQASTSTLLDGSAAATSLINNAMNSSGQLGRYVWQVRGGAVPNLPPVVSVIDRVLEGNASGGFAGYAGTGDAQASDPDGAVASLLNDRPGFLPLGTTHVTWTATDNLGAQSAAVQSILVTDTTAPLNPALVSPSHSVGSWSSASTVTVDSAGASDICSGVQGFSYQWFSGAPGTPDTVRDAHATTLTSTTTTTTVDTQGFATATWPAAWTRSSTTYLRLTNAAGRTHGSYAAEAWANNNTRRTVDFYRDYDLSAYDNGHLRFWDSVSPLAGTGDYARVAYSTDGGATYTQLQQLTAASAWTQRDYALPAGGTVRVRFSASVSGASEYADWDDVEVSGSTTTTTIVPSTHTVTSLADGTWYFALRTADGVGNWSTPVTLGPVRIDTAAPVTSDNAPAGWSRTPVPVTLVATDAGQIVATRYRFTGGAWTDYTGPIVVSSDGVTTIEYYSVDAAGHVEPTRITRVRVDTVAPSPPADLVADADSMTSIMLDWSPSADAGSGVSYYEVLRDGLVIDSVLEPGFTDTDRTAGTAYRYAVRAVDAAGNVSAPCAELEVSIPLNQFYLTVDVPSVTMSAVDPGTRASLPAATVVRVGGVGATAYDLYCSAEDFTEVTPNQGSTFPVGALTYTTGGHATHAERPFAKAMQPIDSAQGAAGEWVYGYSFGFSLDVPWDIDPGTYTTKVTYTVVTR